MSLKPAITVSSGLPPLPDGVAEAGDPLWSERFGDAKYVLKQAGVWWETFGRCSRLVERFRNRWTAQMGIELRLVKGCPLDHRQAIESWKAIGPLMKREWLARHDGPPIPARIIPFLTPKADTTRLWAVAISDDGCRRIRYGGVAKWRSPLTSIVDFLPGTDLGDILPMLAADHGWDPEALEIERLDPPYVPSFMKSGATKPDSSLRFGI